MNTIKHSHNKTPSEANSQLEKDFTSCEKTSQLKKAFATLVKTCGLTKNEIALCLSIKPSMVSMFIDFNGEGREPKIEHAKALSKAVRSQPRIILEALEKIDAEIERQLDMRFGPGKDPNSF